MEVKKLRLWKDHVRVTLLADLRGVSCSLRTLEIGVSTWVKP
jgi:hypothetical protein